MITTKATAAAAPAERIDFGIAPIHGSRDATFTIGHAAADAMLVAAVVDDDSGGRFKVLSLKSIGGAMAGPRRARSRCMSRPATMRCRYHAASAYRSRCAFADRHRASTTNSAPS